MPPLHKPPAWSCVCWPGAAPLPPAALIHVDSNVGGSIVHLRLLAWRKLFCSMHSRWGRHLLCLQAIHPHSQEIHVVLWPDVAHSGLLQPQLHIPHGQTDDGPVRSGTSPPPSAAVAGLHNRAYACVTVPRQCLLTSTSPDPGCSSETSPLWLLLTIFACGPSCTCHKTWLPCLEQAGAGCGSPPPPAAPAAAPPAARAGRHPAERPAAAAAGAQVHPSGGLRCRCSGDCTRNPRGAGDPCQTQGTGAATAGPAAARQCAAQGPEPAAQRLTDSGHKHGD